MSPHVDPVSADFQPTRQLPAMLSTLVDFFGGVVLAVKVLSLSAFVVYVHTEILAMGHGGSLRQLGKTVVRFLFRMGIIEVVPSVDPHAFPHSLPPTSKTADAGLKHQSSFMAKDACESARWLNAILYKVMCTSRSRQFLDTEQDRLLEALTKFSRTAIESKLQDYQRESWLFLRSLNLESFSFGRQLPAIKAVKVFSRGIQSLILVVDFDYAGGIEVGLRAAMAMNIRDFAASLKFVPSAFKLVVKLEGAPTPRVSVMLSDLPAYEMTVTMQSQRLNRAGKLLSMLIANFVRMRACYPNYLTVLFRQSDPLVQVATTKQFQSQLRIRIISVHLGPDNEHIIQAGDDVRVMCVVNFGDTTSKTDVARAASTRWNSIHTFTVFNGLETTPTKVQIVVYQVLDEMAAHSGSLSRSWSSEDLKALNQIGRLEIPYDSITAGLLDIRTVPFGGDASSSATVEMYLHHMEENGQDDAHWIFWNVPRPRHQSTVDQEQGIDQFNWNTVKFIISKLANPEFGRESNDASHESAIGETGVDDSTGASVRIGSSPGTELARCDLNEPLLDHVNATLSRAIRRLRDAVTRHYRDERGDSSPLHLERALSILRVMTMEVTEFSARFDLGREPLSEYALDEHNRRLAGLLLPIVTSFIPAVLRRLEEARLSEERSSHLENIGILEEELREMRLQTEILAAGRELRTRRLAALNSISVPETFDEMLHANGKVSPRAQHVFHCHLGDVPVEMEVNAETGITLRSVETPWDAKPEFALEGVVYFPIDESTGTLKRMDLSSPTLFEDETVIGGAWEILLVGRALVMIPFGHGHFYPQRVIPLVEIGSVSLIKARGAFNLGFDADLSVEAGRRHANNGVLRLVLLTGERINLVGDSRSSDEWFCILASRLGLVPPVRVMPWEAIARIWLMPVDSPAFNTRYCLALTAHDCTFLLGNFVGPHDIHQAYCELRTARAQKQNDTNQLTLNSQFTLRLPPQSSMSLSSSECSSPATPVSRRSDSSWSSTVSSPRDPFDASRGRHERISMHVSLDAPVPPLPSAGTSLQMTSIDHVLSAPVRTFEKTEWFEAVGLVAGQFHCAVSHGPSGTLALTESHVCFSAQDASMLMLIPLRAISGIVRFATWISDGIELKFVSRSDPSITLVSFPSGDALSACHSALQAAASRQ